MIIMLLISWLKKEYYDNEENKIKKDIRKTKKLLQRSW